MSQRFLNDGQIRARVQQMMPEAMPKRMYPLPQLQDDSGLVACAVKDRARPLPAEWEDQVLGSRFFVTDSNNASVVGSSFSSFLLPFFFPRT